MTEQEVQKMVEALAKLKNGEKISYKHLSRITKCSMGTSHFRYVLTKAKGVVLRDHQIHIVTVRKYGVYRCSNRESVMIVRDQLQRISAKLVRIQQIQNNISDDLTNKTLHLKLVNQTLLNSLMEAFKPNSDEVHTGTINQPCMDNNENKTTSPRWQ